MDSPFNQYVNKVLESWTALRIAEQQSTAGRDTKTHIQALLPYILQKLNRQTDEFEVAGWLEDYISDKLNVELEDDSQDTVAKIIVEAYALQLAGKNKEILEKMSKIPNVCDITQCQMLGDNCVDDDCDVSQEDDDDTTGEDDSSVDEDMDTD